MDIAVALGGGGARGIAHLGVFQGLQERGYRVRALAGTSIGGLIGALLVCGYAPEDLRSRFCKLDQRKLFGQRRGDLPSLLGIAGLAAVLADLLGDRQFEDLPIPFAVTAVDIRSNQAVILKKGRIFDAVLATIAIPGIFPPRPWATNRLLVDGGMIDPVPVDVVSALAPGLPTVAVPLAAVPDEPVELHGMSLLAPIPGIDFISRLRMGQALQTFLTAWETSTRLLTQMRLENDRPDAIVLPLVDDIHILGEIDVNDVHERGLQAVARAEGSLARLSNWRTRFAKALRLDRISVRKSLDGFE
ncbi:MAG: patatin-like phospholipase family protein [Chloroflexi bacterium]|nr:patatin-like phospholipase family protein [Chloroflexota bacterium]